MEIKHPIFNENEVLHQLAHFLPSQAPLKDFVHHNPLHAFQQDPFHKALSKASQVFGYRAYLELNEYRNLYQENKIDEAQLDRVITTRHGSHSLAEWKDKLLSKTYDTQIVPRLGKIRGQWKAQFKINLSKEVHPKLFRLIGSYLDQGVSIWSMPRSTKGFLASLRSLERNSYSSLFQTATVRKLLIDEHLTIEMLLAKLLSDPRDYEHYLFDQQFEHPGWSGMVALLEREPAGLIAKRTCSLKDFILFELLLELDVLEAKFGPDFTRISMTKTEAPQEMFAELSYTELDEVYACWQEAFEWTYFDQVMLGVSMTKSEDESKRPSFQALFCIDDREASLRNYLEMQDPACETFGTAGFFNLAFNFKSEHSKFSTKVCPGPIEAKHLIIEKKAKLAHKKEILFTKHNSGFIAGWFTAQTLGFWSAIKMTANIFMPRESPATVSAAKHMQPNGQLGIKHEDVHIEGLKVGYAQDEMVENMAALFRGIGLTVEFAPLVYLIGHGASSVNNTYYAAYDCGACSGRPGSVNARVAAQMMNTAEVRLGLAEKGIQVPSDTQFVGGLHDTTRDEIIYYDLQALTAVNQELHRQNVLKFELALERNAVERARRFDLIKEEASLKQIHRQVKLRSLSLFEPRPEWNHASNALCIVGRRSKTKNLFLDRRAFLQSYDYRTDPDGDVLLALLRAVTPVCAGINLEYYFSRVDNQRLGAGSKLPHNVVGLIALSNGIEGDLRTGLPAQMVDIHDPLRLMLLVEQTPELVWKKITQDKVFFHWFKNEWIILTVIDPITGVCYRFTPEGFEKYEVNKRDLNVITNLTEFVKIQTGNIPVKRITV